MSGREDRRARLTGRRGTTFDGSFTSLPWTCFKSPEYSALSFRARALLIEVALQYNGRNNGRLCAAHSVVRARGFRSKDQLSKALRELLQAGWIVLTRQGGRTKASWYALTFRPIDSVPELEIKAGGALNLWRKELRNVRDPVLSEIAPSRRGYASKAPRETVNVAPTIGALLTRIAGNRTDSNTERRTTADQIGD